MTKRLLTYLTLFLILMSFNIPEAFCQPVNGAIKVEGDYMIVRFDKRNTDEFKNLLLYFNLHEDSLFQFQNIGKLANEGWAIMHTEKNYIEIGRALNADVSKINWGSQPIFFDNVNPPGEPGYPGPVAYGTNDFKKSQNVFENNEGKTLFFLKGNSDAQQVFLAGNFNNWREAANAMQKTDSGWIATINLEPGKYYYKFIVDGIWSFDQNNNLKDLDGYGSFNSTYFRTNYTFSLVGYLNKKNVIVAGSFNEWREKELKMHRIEDGWQLDLYLNEGTHTYKFIVDGDWILDPQNKNVRNDGENNFNSVIALGTPANFILNGFTDAKQVILSGTFNNWNGDELIMTKTETGWFLPYVLAPGNYAYKYIVDGKWIADPDNLFFVGGGDIKNSVKIVKPNFTFTLNDFPQAKQVLISGDFNGWADPGYTMIHGENGWICPVYLSPGKHLYKYIVDGKWIIDPHNTLYEENEFNTGNSVLWMK